MRKLLLILSPVLLFVTGCGANYKFTYPDDHRKLVKLYDKPKYPLNVGVLPLEDERGNTNNSGGYFLYLVPLMPFGEAHYNRPESAKPFNTISEFDFSPAEDLAKAIATSLRNSNLFENVYFSYGPGDSDLLITGSMKSTEWKGKVYSYGLSVFGPNLWFFGLPAGSSYNQLALDLYLKKPDTKEILWDYSINKERRIVQGLYYEWGKDVKGYSLLMQDGMNEAVKSLAERLNNIPLENMQKKNE
ncbi:MAG: hypothetical protein ABH872_05620 [Candidatus Omnitrophota bacterium]